MKRSFLTLSLMGFVGFVSSLTSALSQEEITSKFQASMLAGAVGDALGFPIEKINMPYAHRPVDFYALEKNHKEWYPNGIRSFDDLHKDDFKKVAWSPEHCIPLIPWKFVAPYTDDTAMAKLNLELLAPFAYAKNNDWYKYPMNRIAQKYAEDMDNENGWSVSWRAPGIGCLQSVSVLYKSFNSKEKSLDWYAQGYRQWLKASPTERKNIGGGCGAVMRAHPFGLVFFEDPERAAFLAVEQSKITHGAPISFAACAAMATGVAYAVQNKSPEFIAQKMIDSARKYDEVASCMLERAVAYAQDPNKPSEKVFQEFLGWAAHEAIAAVLYIFMKNPNDIQKAIALGVNTPGDSDSIASMAGALVGARVGMDDIPKDWQDKVENGDCLLDLAEKAASK